MQTERQTETTRLLDKALKIEQVKNNKLSRDLIQRVAEKQSK